MRGNPTVSLVAYWAVDGHAFNLACEALEAADGRSDEFDEAYGTAAGREASKEATFARIVARWVDIW